MSACLATARVSTAEFRLSRARRRLLNAGAPDWPSRNDPRHTPCVANLSAAERDAGCVGARFVLTRQAIEEVTDAGAALRVVIHEITP